MAVTLTGTEGLWTRFGKIYKEYQRVVAAYGSALTSGADAIYEQYATGADDVAIDGLPTLRENYRGVHSSYQTGLVNIATKTLIEQVHRDNPLPNKTLVAALNEIIRQMVASSDSFNRPTISASLAQWGSNAGDGTFVTCMTDGYGDPLDMCFAEDIKFTCTGDSSTGTQYRETYTYSGEPVLPVSNYQWPGGSGATGSITLFDAGSQNDLISNGGFDTWTNASAAPDSSWVETLGTFGSTITRSSSNKRGTYSLALNSNGSTLLGIKQQLSTSLVKPNQVIIFNSWMKIDTLDGTGVVRIRLTDGAGTTLTNDASTSQSYTRNVNGNIGTSFTNITTSFQTPRQLPSTGVYLVIEFSTSPANSRVVTIDLVGLKIGTALYAGGPYIAGFSNATNNAVRDYSTLTIANDATANFFVKALDRFYDLRAKGIHFPSAGSQTVEDSLLTA